MTRLGVRAYQRLQPLGAGVAQLVDAATSHVAERKRVWVRLPPPARPSCRARLAALSSGHVRGCRVAIGYAQRKPGSVALSGFRAFTADPISRSFARART